MTWATDNIHRHTDKMTKENTRNTIFFIIIITSNGSAVSHEESHHRLLSNINITSFHMTGDITLIVIQVPHLPFGCIIISDWAPGCAAQRSTEETEALLLTCQFL